MQLNNEKKNLHRKWTYRNKTPRMFYRYFTRNMAETNCPLFIHIHADIEALLKLRHTKP